MRNRNRFFIALAIAVAVGAGVGIGSAGSHTQTVPGPRVTITATQPGPEVTVTASPPPPATGQQIARFHGTGTEVTPAFNVPNDGNYIVTWKYSGNVDNSFGNTQATNFSIQENGNGMGLGLPNDIATDGHGSTQVTGASGTDSFNVQAGSGASWTITITAA